MKKILLALVFAFVAGAAAQQVQAQAAINLQNPTLEFKEMEHDFGDLQEGISAEYSFEFTNRSGAAVLLQNVKASCGCTTPAWTREPIPAGGTGFVKATYNTANRPGPFNKSITVTLNNGEQIVLRISGKVI